MLRDWTDSESVNALSASAETLFVRLIMKADDYGCFHGSPALVRSFCFPLRETMRNTEVSHWLDELQAAGLIALYAGSDDKMYLQILNFGQRLKLSRHRFPEPRPDTKNGAPASAVPEVPGSSRKFPEQNENENTEGEENKSVSIACAYANDAERIAGLYPKAKIGDWKQVVYAVLRAIQREIDRGATDIDAVAILEKGTIDYAKAASKIKHKRFIYQAKKFYDDGIYNNDPETWEDAPDSKQKGMRNDSSYEYTSELG